jgi:hypothetical protein
MKSNWFGAVIGAAVLAAAMPAQAQMVSPTNPAALLELVKAGGDKMAKLETPKGENPYISGEHNSLKYLVIFMNCDDANKNCKTVQFYMGYSDAKKTTLEKLNDWNRDRRFARAYRDKDGDPVLEMDLDMDFKGLPKENVAEALGTWKALMGAFQTHIHGEGGDES